MSSEIGENRDFVYTPKGSKFAKGNKIGRMKKKGFTLADLNKAAYEYGKTRNKDILEHYISRLYKNDTLLQNYIEKNAATKNIQELTGNITYVIEKIDYTKGLDGKNRKN